MQMVNAIYDLSSKF